MFNTFPSSLFADYAASGYPFQRPLPGAVSSEPIGQACRIRVGFLACFGQNSQKNGYTPFNTLLYSLRKDEFLKHCEAL